MSAGRRWGLVAGALLVLLAAVVVIYAGLYNIAADVPHTQPVYWLLETIRGRSVASHARNIVIPNDLEDANRISKGAGQYADGHLSAETDTNQTADPESNSGSAEPYSDLAKPRKYDAAAGKQACTCADRKQGDTTRNDPDDDRTPPRQEQKT